MKDERNIKSTYYFLSWLMKDRVVEIRTIDLNGSTFVGYFDDPKTVIKTLHGDVRSKRGWNDTPRDGECKGIYFVLNEFSPDLQARAKNRLVRSKISTSDVEIINYRLILIDCDPKRPSGVSSTQHEKHLASGVVRRVRRWLIDNGISSDSILTADSGNGFHLLISTCIPNTPQTVLFVKTLLNHLSGLFSTPTVSVDTTVYNPARICKLYGTLTMKGDSTPERPHKYSSIYFNPQHPPTQTDLRCLPVTVTTQPTQPGAGGSNQENNIRLIVDMLTGEKQSFRRKDKIVHGSSPDVVFELEHCPVHGNLTGSDGPDGDTYECCIGVETTGKIWSKCQHIPEKTWQDFKAALHFDKYQTSQIADDLSGELLVSIDTYIKSQQSQPSQPDEEKDRENYNRIISSRTEWEELPCLIPTAGLFMERCISSVAGEAGVGKSTVLMAGVVIPMLHGEPVLGSFHMPKVKTLLIQSDNDESYYMNRIILPYGYHHDTDKAWLRMLHTKNTPMPVNYSNIMVLITKAIKYDHVRWIIIDNRTSLCPESVYGMTALSKSLTIVEDLKVIAIQYGVSITMVEHIRKNMTKRPWELVTLDDVIGSTTKTLEQCIGINARYDLIRKTQTTSSGKVHTKETFLRRSGEGIIVPLKNSERIGSGRDLIQYSIQHDETQNYLMFDEYRGIYQELTDDNGIELPDSPASSKILEYFRTKADGGTMEFTYNFIAADTGVGLSTVKKVLYSSAIDWGITIIDSKGGRGQKARVVLSDKTKLRPKVNVDLNNIIDIPM